VCDGISSTGLLPFPPLSITPLLPFLKVQPQKRDNDHQAYEWNQKKRKEPRTNFYFAQKHRHLKDQAAVSKLQGLTRGNHLMISCCSLLSEESNGERQSCFAEQHVPHVFTPGGVLQVQRRRRRRRRTAVVGVYISCAKRQLTSR